MPPRLINSPRHAIDHLTKMGRLATIDYDRSPPVVWLNTRPMSIDSSTPASNTRENAESDALDVLEDHGYTVKTVKIPKMPRGSYGTVRLDDWASPSPATVWFESGVAVPANSVVGQSAQGSDQPVRMDSQSFDQPISERTWVNHDSSWDARVLGNQEVNPMADTAPDLAPGISVTEAAMVRIIKSRQSGKKMTAVDSVPSDDDVF